MLVVAAMTGGYMAVNIGAYDVAAAITVIIATQFGLPVSCTHIAVGAVFGVGFLREYLKASHAKRLDEIKDHHHGSDEQIV